MTKILEVDEGDGCTTMQMNYTLIKYDLSDVFHAVFYHNLKKWTLKSSYEDCLVTNIKHSIMHFY